MPELPEVEFARRVIEESALDREIADVDDADSYECRPHTPGQIRDRLVGRSLVSARRRGKQLWCPTSDDGPDLGIHLGMSGRIVVDEREGGDPQRGRLRKDEWFRFTLVFADGGRMRLLDQSTIAGVGNLLADEVLWQARLDPRRTAGELDDDELDGLRRALRAGIRHAEKHGGVHTGEVIAHRSRGGHCPRCGAAMSRATVGGRTTYWCPTEQV